VTMYYLLLRFTLVKSGLLVYFSLFQSVPATDVETLLTMNWDPNIALSITSELVVMEVINRVFICIFEVTTCFIFIVYMCQFVLLSISLYLLFTLYMDHLVQNNRFD